MEKYDISKNVWIEIGSMIKKRSNPMLAVDNGYLYAFFGRGENGEYPESIERLNIEDDKSTWEIILFRNPNKINTKLYGSALYQMNKIIYFFGGKCNEETIADIFFFNLSERRFCISNEKLKLKKSFRENTLFKLGRKMVQITDEKFFGIYLNFLLE